MRKIQKQARLRPDQYKFLVERKDEINFSELVREAVDEKMKEYGVPLQPDKSAEEVEV